jgi:Ni/Fe-hydrogenase subunit HybB-like protein
MITAITGLRRTVPALLGSRHWPLLISLAFLALLGLLAGITRLVLGLGATTGLSDAYPWGLWIGFDFLLIALSGAGFTMAAAGHILHIRSLQEAVRPAILTGLMGYVSVLLLLVLDLGRPDRFYHFILFWNVHSPLFEISWCVLLYTTVLLIETGPYACERLGWTRPVRWFLRLLTPITVIGVTLSTLHQSTLGTLYLNMPHRLHPLWYTPLLPLLFYGSSILAGLSVSLLSYRAAVRVAGRREAPEVVAGLMRGMAIVGGLYLALRVGEVVVAGKWPLLRPDQAMARLWWLEVGLGGIVPWLLVVRPRWRQRPSLTWLVPLLLILGIGANRFNATWFAQTPPQGGNYWPHPLEWFSTLGILAGAALAWYLGIRLLVIFESKAERLAHS